MWNVPVGEQHHNAHGTNCEDDVEPGVLSTMNMACQDSMVRTEHG